MTSKIEALGQEDAAMRVNSVDREILETLINTKAVNFEAIGQTIGAVGSKAVFLDDGWIRWCGSDLRIYRWPGPRLDLDRLAGIRDSLAGVALGQNR